MHVVNGTQSYIFVVFACICICAVMRIKVFIKSLLAIGYTLMPLVFQIIYSVIYCNPGIILSYRCGETQASLKDSMSSSL